MTIDSILESIDNTYLYVMKLYLMKHFIPRIDDVILYGYDKSMSLDCTSHFLGIYRQQEYGVYELC